VVTGLGPASCPAGETTAEHEWDLGDLQRRRGLLESLRELLDGVRFVRHSAVLPRAGDFESLPAGYPVTMRLSSASGGSPGVELGEPAANGRKPSPLRVPADGHVTRR